MFCHQCILQFLDSQHTSNVSCPTCQMPMNTNALQPSKFVQRQLGRLTIRCQYQTLGCTWVGLLSSDHISQCTFQARQCMNADHGCTQRLDSKTMEQHEIECEYGVMECPNGSCSSSFLRKDISQHESTCPSYPCSYASNGCQFIGTIPDVNTHCAMYCGRLHDRIQQLEQECLLLSQQLELKKILQQPDYNHHTTSSTSDISQIQATSTHQSQHNTMDLANDPLLQVVNDSDIFKLMEPTAKSNNSTSVPASPNKIHSSPVSSGAPKRTPKGKRIRYSKNTKLAHGALRASKTAATPSTPGGDDDMPLDYSTQSPRDSVASTPGTTTALIDEAPSPASVGTPNSEDLTRLMDTLSTNSQHAHSPLSFHTLDDVAKFFETLPPVSSPQHHQQQQQQQYDSSPIQHQQRQHQHQPMIPAAMKKKLLASPSSPNVHSPLSPSSSTADAATQKPNPMFVLASSYLSNYK
ncbi:unnamed protein product [Absidia cylindrospora]